MPNNPGRIGGDYSIGEKEEVHYVDPGNFGAARVENPARNLKLYAFAAGAAVAAAILAGLWWHFI